MVNVHCSHIVFALGLSLKTFFALLTWHLAPSLFIKNFCHGYLYSINIRLKPYPPIQPYNYFIQPFPCRYIHYHYLSGRVIGGIIQIRN